MRFASMSVFCVALLGPLSRVSRAAGPADWYYSEGPLRGSLKSAAPLPLYDPDPQHLWNRLFAAFYIRPSELPSRPAYPHDSTQLDAWDRKLRVDALPLGPIVNRIEGGDVLAFLAWPKTRYFSEPETAQRLEHMLDEFLAAHGERLIADPLKRAFLQRDLWAVFDHLARQNMARFGDADLARRRAAVPEYEIEPAELQRDDRGALARRERLCRKLAVILRRLALSKAAIAALPDNYAATIASGAFAAEHGFDPRRNYLPPGLLTRPDEWVEIDNRPGSQHREKAEGQLTFTSWSIRGRSYYRIFWRFPEGGRPAVEEYLACLQREGVDWEKSAKQGSIALKPTVRQIPVGFEAAIVELMVLLDERLEPTPTHLVELAHTSIYKNTEGRDDPQTSSGRGVNFAQYVARRRLLFDGLKNGGLERQADDAATYRTLLTTPRDWGAFGRQQSVVQSCLHCHMHERERVGVHSLNSISCYVPEHGMPGVVMPLGAGEVHTYSRAERTVRWKVGQEEYLRLVEYARDETTSRPRTSGD